MMNKWKERQDFSRLITSLPIDKDDEILKITIDGDYETYRQIKVETKKKTFYIERKYDK